jgi:glucose/arabinose dehydrogenase
VLPNGDVTVAEALFEPGPVKTLFGHAMVATMRRAAAVGPSPNRITLLRDADGDGIAEQRHVLLDGLQQPFGMALVDGQFYVGNTNGVVAFPYADSGTHHRAGPPAVQVPLQRPLDTQPAGQPRRPQALRRRGC